MKNIKNTPTNKDLKLPDGKCYEKNASDVGDYLVVYMDRGIGGFSASQFSTVDHRNLKRFIEVNHSCLPENLIRMDLALDYNDYILIDFKEKKVWIHNFFDNTYTYLIRR